MSNDYSFENFQKRRDAIKNKKNNEPKSLLRLFSKTFAITLFSFLVIATIISPHLNIPALNDDTESMQDMGSSDFKSRIDYRLQEIKLDDTTPNQGMPKKETNQQLQEAMETANNLVKVDLSTFNTPQLPAKNYNNTPTTPNFKNSTVKPDTATLPQETPSNSQQKLKAQQPSSPYIPKAQQSKNYKILVGDYTSPEDAQKAADMFSTVSNSPVKPFIKSYNGLYSVQVGSYNDAQKAQSMAGSYKSKNYKVKIIEQ